MNHPAPALDLAATRARHPVAALVLLLAVTLGARLAVLPGSREANMDPDAAHFLNIAHCFAAGQGFSNPAAWPAWIRPARLPMPETFKEPAYPYAISKLAPLVGDPFRAGQLISLLAGLLLPFFVYGLGRTLDADPRVGLVAGFAAAGSPLLLAQSVRVMVDSLFAAVVCLLFWAATARGSESARARPLLLDLAVGALLGLTFLLRAQTLLILPALGVLYLLRRPLGTSLVRLAFALAAALLVASPLLLRNLRLFGTPLHSDVAAYGIWPYVDHLAFSHGLDRPPAPLAFVLHHVPQVFHHMALSLVRFALHSLPEDILGNALWMPLLAAGALACLARWRRWLFAYVYLGLTITFVMAVHWDARYFASTVALFGLFAAAGAAWLARAVASTPLAGRLTGGHLLAAALAVSLTVQTVAARREAAGGASIELAAARAEGPRLARHLAADEAVMAVTTSYWSWTTGRPSVHLVIADQGRFLETVRRLHVRYAALPTSRLAEFAARYPGGRLPSVLVPDHADPALDLTVFAVDDPARRGQNDGPGVER